MTADGVDRRASLIAALESERHNRTEVLLEGLAAPYVAPPRPYSEPDTPDQVAARKAVLVNAFLGVEWPLSLTTKRRGGQALGGTQAA